MKNRLYTLMISAMILCSTSLFAREPEVNVVSQGEDKLAMKLFTYEASAVVRIVDENGYLLFTEKTEKKQPQYAKIFDMATLPAGSYQFEVEGENTYKVIAFTIIDGKVTLTGTPVSYFKPVISQRGDITDLQLLNSAGQDVKVSFSDSKGEVLFVEKPDSSIRIEKRFSLAELERGIYTMTVQVGQKFYHKKLIVQ